MRTPQITSEKFKTPLERQKTPQNLQEPFRTARNELERSGKSQNIPKHQNRSELVRTSQNVSEDPNKVRECLSPPETFVNHENALEFPTKHPRMSQSASEPSGTFQNSSELVETSLNNSEYPRMSKSTKNFSKQFRTVQN